ncbi:DNA glycosylase superfamily protein [Actinidia rufa]|uniref:DNA glycosylase superfamily protein n=1 Tax=Actinidia rufa TaxID=165716 RepID=A0A7J0DB59_9ERIC|nr:DNA glycosylase superfamily protein [Actinidia rufa]
MSGVQRVRTTNVADSEFWPVTRKSLTKPLRKTEKSLEEEVMALDEKNGLPSSAIVEPLTPQLHSVSIPSVLRRNLSLNASCSSDASSDSFNSRASTGRIYRTNSIAVRRRQLALKSKTSVLDGISEPLQDSLQVKKRCAWVTAHTDPRYATFHDEEWGLPEHDDKKLFELLVFSGALAELTWPAILSKRHIFREVFADFDPMIVAKFSDKKITAPGSTASSLLSELKLRAIIENACQISKVIVEFGSFDKYIWSFVNYKPVISRFRYPRQIPVRTAKADVISKDLVRRGFRSVGPTVIYSFMQVAGMTNDHLISCFRFQECVTAAEGKEADVTINGVDDKQTAELIEADICRAIDELSFTSE